MPLVHNKPLTHIKPLCHQTLAMDTGGGGGGSFAYLLEKKNYSIAFGGIFPHYIYEGVSNMTNSTTYREFRANTTSVKGSFTFKLSLL